MSSTSPVMKPARGDARNVTACATSSGSQNRPTGIAASCVCRCAAVSCSETIGDITQAGAMAFAVSPSPAISRAMEKVSPIIAAFETA
jgi:hypothetical protein